MKLIKQALVTSLRQDHLRNYNHYISITRVPMATKLGKMITYLDWLLLIKSHDPLISWSCKITLQNKTTISPLSERLWLPNLAGWYRSYLDGPAPIKSRHPLITWSCEITWQTKIFYLSRCLHQTLQDVNLPWYAPAYNVTLPFDHVVFRDHMRN